MQVNRCIFQAPMSQQELDRTQVGSGLQQVRRKAMAQDIPVLLMVCIPRKSATAITRVME
jgi:hypothetical protein